MNEKEAFKSEGESVAGEFLHREEGAHERAERELAAQTESDSPSNSQLSAALFHSLLILILSLVSLLSLTDRAEEEVDRGVENRTEKDARRSSCSRDRCVLKMIRFH